MPHELVADWPGHAVLQQYSEPILEAEQIRVRSLFSSVKHGTELRVFSGQSEDSTQPFDPELRLHRREDGAKSSIQFPLSLGNMCFGVVTEMGPAVSRFKVGDHVFAHLHTRETHTVHQDSVRLAPPHISPQTLMYWDPATFALGGIRDGNVRLGDRVAVFGLGAIGQMAVQMARIAGAGRVVAIDPIEARRQAALKHGADLVLDPKAVDVGVTLKMEAGKMGVDVAMETSGSPHAFYDALRSIRYQGTLVSTAYYVGALQGLYFAGEWHRNRPKLISSRACSDPQLDFGWDYERIETEALALLTDGRLNAEDLIDPIVPFERAATAYQEINEHPERSIKLGIDHTL